MNKKLKEYDNKYKDIPKLFKDRFLYLIELLKIKPKEIDKIKKSIRHNIKMDYKTISFVFYFTPQATPRPRYSRFTKAFYVKNALNYNELFGKYIKESDINIIINTPCEFYCTTYHPIPKSMNRIETVLAELGLIHVISKPDFDNLAKTYSDMMQKHLLQDDALIYKGVIEKCYSILPRIEITIKYLDGYDSNFNERKANKIRNK